MEFGTGTCHRVISALWVGDATILVVLTMIALCEALLVWLVYRTVFGVHRSPLRPVRARRAAAATGAPAPAAALDVTS